MKILSRRARFARDHRWAPRQMSAYLDGELVVRARRRLELHTRDCPECRGVLHSLQRMLSQLHELPPESTPHGGATGIAAAVRQRLGEQHRV